MSGAQRDESSKIDRADVEKAIEVLERVAKDRGVLAAVDAPTRERLQRLAGEVARPDVLQRRRLRKNLARVEREEKKLADEARRRATGIRRLREAPLFSTPPPPAPLVFASHDRTFANVLSGEETAKSARPGAAELREPRKCYVCKRSYQSLHPFYDQLCPACGDRNYARRFASADLRGRVALVTGARVKIGYQAAILLLRAGCSVVALTRFPRDAASRYAREPDFLDWQSRLQVHGIDLRHTPSVENLCQALEISQRRLDFQIHNACQTVRRPPGFYGHLVEGELAPFSSLSASEQSVLEAYEDLRPQRGAHALIGVRATKTRPGLLLEDGVRSSELFPEGTFDADRQQVDLSPENSWRLRLDEVPTRELLEVLLVNTTAPFVMTARLKALMVRSDRAPPGTATSSDSARHVVLVSAMEGQFYRDHKTDKHPHTNLAKAALNMIVRTSAADLVRDGIHLNAVDTGWVTDEDPVHLAARKAEEHAFSPPLDIVDGAARIVAPIFEGFTTGRHVSGVFFKDYAPTPW